MSRALYSATLLVQGSVRENARGMTWFRGEMSTIPTPATSPSRGMVRDAPSKYICQTEGLAWVECTLAVSSVVLQRGWQDLISDFLQESPRWLVPLWPFGAESAYRIATAT